MNEKIKDGIIIAAAAGAACTAGTFATGNHVVDLTFDAHNTEFSRKFFNPQPGDLPPFPAPNAAIQRTMIANLAWLEETLEAYEAEAVTERIVRTTDGGQVRLVGYLYYAVKPARRWVILVHGYRGRHEEMRRYAALYAQHGFNVFMPDLRSHGESDGRYIGMGWTDGDDILDWADYLVERFGGDIDIVLHGHSMGAATVLAASARSRAPQIVSVIADSGYSSVWDVMARAGRMVFHVPSFPLLNAANTCFKARGGYDLHAASFEHAIRFSHTPTLIIHGAEDRFVPVRMAPRLYHACGAPIKELHVIPNAGHVMAQLVDPHAYEQMVFGFLGRVENGR
jgi:alpha-beta hydrolase superfamily lysophospholipase